MKIKAWTAALLFLPALACAETYSIHDSGDFSPAGFRVEFADRYGWSSYDVDFNFSVEGEGRTLSRGSKLTLRVKRLNGRVWSYQCKAKGSAPMTANVNMIYGTGISVVADCAISEKSFAKAVDMDAEDVGQPHLVFQAIVQDGKASVGDQRGLYFVSGGQMASSDLSAYASTQNEASLAVVFRSN